MGLFGARCWRCGMRRIGARRFCPACGADLVRRDPMALPASRRSRSTAGQSAARERPSAPHARPFDEPRLRGTVWQARPSAGSRVAAGKAGPAVGSARARGGFLASLEAPTRRKLLRLAGELVLLTAVVAVVYGGPALQGAPRLPAATSTPAIRVATLGLAANELTVVFSSGRFGGFEFTDEGRVDGAPLLSGVSADGATSLALWGYPGDLERVTMTFELTEPRILDGAQRRHIQELLALFAPNALEPLLAELRAALDEGRASRRTFASGRIAARLQVNAGGTFVAVILLPSRIVDDEVNAPGTDPSGSPPPLESPAPT